MPESRPAAHDRIADVRTVRQIGPMNAARAYLLTALQRVVDGGDITNEELDAAIPDPLALERAERDAWEQLSHWADDADIRVRDAHYASFKRDWMRDYIAKLSG